jgi:hypothetical protein
MGHFANLSRISFSSSASSASNKGRNLAEKSFVITSNTEKEPTYPRRPSLHDKNALLARSLVAVALHV